MSGFSTLAMALPISVSRGVLFSMANGGGVATMHGCGGGDGCLEWCPANSVACTCPRDRRDVLSAAHESSRARRAGDNGYIITRQQQR